MFDSRVTLARLSLVLLCLLSSGCSPGYVVRAAYEQGKVLLARRPIAEVIEDDATPLEEREKMRIVLEAREYARQIGLDPGGSFTQYSDVGKDTLAWVVIGARKDSFNVYTWWFPIVGTVPYKGFFDKDDAIAQARELETQGYETSIRGTDAFSTLGWFNDPLLSTTLKGSPERIASTVLHESVHSTVWIPGSVPFNESLANFVGTRATVDFFAAQQEVNRGRVVLGESIETRVKKAEMLHRSAMEFADCVSTVYATLDELYSRSDLSADQKIVERQGVFEEVLRGFRSRGNSCASLKALNNADLLQSAIYTREQRLFEELHLRVNGLWPRFFEKVTEIERRLREARNSDPFAMLAKIVAEAEG